MASIQQKRIVFYTIIYVGIFIIAITSLSVNFKTIPVYETTIQNKKKLQILTQKNQALEVMVTSANRLSEVESIAKTKLSMSPPSRIRYLKSR